MLTNLHVKNLALIDEVDIDFKKRLNIITGETGAGKSLILGSVNLALGGKAGSDLIGHFGDSALVEISFLVDDEKAKMLEAMDVFPEDGTVTISRRILEGRSVIKVNGETMSAASIRKITELLIDIHGQHDHQSLLYKSKHLEILDRYAKDALDEIMAEYKDAFSELKSAEKKLEGFTISDEERIRKISFLTYEVEEIENAALKPNEDEEIEALYRKMVNSKKITEETDSADRMLFSDNCNASDLISRALVSISRITEYDDGVKNLVDELTDIESLINDFGRDFKDFISSMEFDDGEFTSVEERLNLINGLKAKHGGSLESIEEYYKKAQEELDFYSEYEANLDKARTHYEECQAKVLDYCNRITDIRKNSALALEKAITSSLLDLNFNQIKFQIDISPLAKPENSGKDEVEFLISLNPGEAVKPLSKVASGGELSRIMLGIKSVLAGKDDIDSLIFDEIDTGISGRTAQKVSEKMAAIAGKHQVICITHLPQIAAMADTHFLIEKSVENNMSKTDIHELNDDEIITELSRMLSGMEITEVVKDNARQMKKLANDMKGNI